MSRGVSTARSSSESLCYSVTSIASSTREAESDSYSVSSARATPTLSAAPGTAESDSYTESAAQLKAWGEATSISINMSRGRAWLKGRAEQEQVAKLTARGRLLRAQFWVPVRIFQTSPRFFSLCRVELDFLICMKGPKSSHFSVLNFVTSGGVFWYLSRSRCVTNFLPGELSVQVHQNTNYLL